MDNFNLDSLGVNSAQYICRILFAAACILPAGLDAQEVSTVGVITPQDSIEDVLAKARAAREPVELLTGGTPVKGIIVDYNETLIVLRDPSKFMANVTVLKKKR